MKAKTYIIESDTEKEYCLFFVSELPIDGRFQVVVQNVDKSSTGKQRGLKWRWNDDISKAGLGGNDTPKTVHLWNKKEFGHPILMRDDNNYAILFRAFRDNVKTLVDYIDRMKWFVENHVLTEDFTRGQQAEYLTWVQKYWVSKGVNLVDPDNYGKNLLRFKPEKEK